MKIQRNALLVPLLPKFILLFHFHGSKILFYFGAGLITFSAYEHLVANDDKTAVLTASAGAICTVGALAFWVIPRQPRFDFTTKHLLELLQTEPAK